jgi:hypothetical protein
MPVPCYSSWGSSKLKKQIRDKSSQLSLPSHPEISPDPADLVHPENPCVIPVAVLTITKTSVLQVSNPQNLKMADSYQGVSRA